MKVGNYLYRVFCPIHVYSIEPAEASVSLKYGMNARVAVLGYLLIHFEWAFAHIMNTSTLN